MLLDRPETDVNVAKFTTGVTPLWVASFRGHEGNVELLLGHPDVEVNRVTGEDVGGTSPLLMACQAGTSSTVSIIRNGL